MDFPFEGIPTVPPRKDMDHMVGAFESAPPATALTSFSGARLLDPASILDKWSLLAALHVVKHPRRCFSAVAAATA